MHSRVCRVSCQIWVRNGAAGAVFSRVLQPSRTIASDVSASLEQHEQWLGHRELHSSSFRWDGGSKNGDSMDSNTTISAATCDIKRCNQHALPRPRTSFSANLSANVLVLRRDFHVTHMFKWLRGHFGGHITHGNKNLDESYQPRTPPPHSDQECCQA